VQRRHSVRSFATCLAWFHDDHPMLFLSVSAVLLQLTLGRPIFLFPSGAQVIATWHWSFLSLLSMWSSQSLTKPVSISVMCQDLILATKFVPVSQTWVWRMRTGMNLLQLSLLSCYYRQLCMFQFQSRTVRLWCADRSRHDVDSAACV